MHAIQIRNVNPSTYQRLKALAREDKRSLQQEAAWLLERSLEIFGASDPKNWTQARKIQQEMRARFGNLPDTTPLIRQMREER